jgi:probable F420-dependent oxidoreductase
MHTHPEKMRVGVCLPHYGAIASRDAIVAVAVAAEALGYSDLWVLERMLRPVASAHGIGGAELELPPSYAVVFDPLETLTLAASVSSRIGLGTSILDALFHVPAVLARRLATVDQISGGRLTVGLGQGWMPQEFASAGIPLTRRGRGFEEFIAALRASWGPDPVEFAGEFYVIPASQIGPKPVQPGGPPLILGATSDAGIRRAARIADGFNPDGLDPAAGRATWERLTEQLGVYRGEVDAAGRPAEKTKVVVRCNVRVSASPLVDAEPMSGNVEQMLAGLKRLEAIGVQHVVLDMTMQGTPVEQQLEVMRQLSASLWA